MRLRSNTVGLAFRLESPSHVGDSRAEFSIRPVVTEETKTVGTTFFEAMKECP
jgi:hypothetical protein